MRKEILLSVVVFVCFCGWGSMGYCQYDMTGANMTDKAETREQANSKAKQNVKAMEEISKSRAAQNFCCKSNRNAVKCTSGQIQK